MRAVTDRKDATPGRAIMQDDSLLLLLIVGVWLLLAAIYAFVPGLGMPGYARVWGGGAVVFLVLAGLVWRAGRQSAR